MRQITVQANFNVSVNPLDVIKAMLDHELGEGRKLEYNPYHHIPYIVEYSTVGPYEEIAHIEITKEHYVYIQALQTVVDYLDKESI